MFVYVLTTGILHGETLTISLYKSKDKAILEALKIVDLRNDFIQHPESNWWDNGKYFVSVQSNMILDD